MRSFQNINFGGIELAVDIESTLSAYANRPAIPIGGCDCAPCRNAAADWPSPLGEGARELLRELGIDIMKPSEIVHFGRSEAKHRYQAAYHARARIDSRQTAANIRGFRWSVKSPGTPIEPGFLVSPVIELAVEFELPWRIDEAEPE